MVEILGVENVEESHVVLTAELTESLIIGSKLFEETSIIISHKETLVIYQARYLISYRVLHLSPQIGDGLEKRIRLHANLQFLETEGDPTNPTLEQFRMIADLSELHDQVHQVFHLGLVFNELEQIFG